MTRLIAHQTADRCPGCPPVASEPGAGEFDAMVEQYIAGLREGADMHWWQIRDPRKPIRTRATGRWRKRTEEVTVYEKCQVTYDMSAAYDLLTACRDTLARLSLPTDSPLPGQVDAAVVRLFEMADTIAARYYPKSGYARQARKSVEHAQALRMAAQVAALVNLAEQRESVLHAVDPASLARTAAALTSDLAAARAYLSVDPIDRRLEIAAAARP